MWPRHSSSTGPLLAKIDHPCTPKGDLGFSLSERPVFSKHWLQSLLQAGCKKAGLFVWHRTNPLTQRLMPFRSSVFTVSICYPRGIRSQLSRLLRKDICRIPLAFPSPLGFLFKCQHFLFTQWALLNKNMTLYKMV